MQRDFHSCSFGVSAYSLPQFHFKMPSLSLDVAINFLKISVWSWPQVDFPSCGLFYSSGLGGTMPLTPLFHQSLLQLKTVVFYNASDRNIFLRSWMFICLSSRLSQALKRQLLHDQGSSQGISKIYSKPIPVNTLMCFVDFYHQLSKCQRLVCKGYQELG